METPGADTTEREALAGAPGTGERAAVGSDTDGHTVWLATSESAAVPEGDTYERSATERDTADDWRLEPGSAPATVAELEKRIDAAVAAAQAAEGVALEIGESSLEAAKQARHAAELAERASAAAVQAASEAASAAESAARAEAAAPAPPSSTAPASPAAPAAPIKTAPPAASAVPSATAPPPAAAAAATSTPIAPDPPTPTAPPPEAVVAQPAPPRPTAADFLPRPERAEPLGPDPFEERVTAFRRRAEKVMIRLQKLEAGADPGAGPTEIVRLTS